MQPTLHTASSIQAWACSTLGLNGKWIPARPLPFSYGIALEGLRRRWELAWGVFTGRYDALDWENRR